MKKRTKRILSMLLALTMIMGIFTGCGAGASMEKITVSEMLANVMEENDGEAVIFTHVYDDNDNYKKSFSEKTRWEPWNYDGETLSGLNAKDVNGESVSGSKRPTLNEFFSAVSYEKNPGIYASGEPSWKIDVSRENTPVEYMQLNGCWYPSVFFGKCEHVEIDGTSYMFFTSYIYDNKDGLVSTHFTLIKDTEYTKDKLVVVDSTEDISTRTWDLNNQFQDHAYISELTDEDKATSGIED